jgi:hypothetical protein
MRLMHGRAPKFTSLPNAVFLDRRLSLTAKGVYGFIGTCPDGFEITAEAIAQFMPDRTEDIEAALDELDRYGYLDDFTVEIDEPEAGR